MHKIEKLLQTLVPKGVEFRKLGDIGEFYGGLVGKSKKSFSQGNKFYVPYVNVFNNPQLDLNALESIQIGDKEKQNTIQLGDVLFTGSSENLEDCAMSCVVTQKIEKDIYLNSFCFGFRFFDKNLFNPSFLKHFLRDYNFRKNISKVANGVTRFNVSKKLLSKITIPIPPLEVQQEIVKILDQFLALTTDLQTGIPAEIKARKKQYEYYQNMLLDFNDINSNHKDAKEKLSQKTYPKNLKTLLQTLAPKGVEFKTLGEVFEIKNGYTPSKNNPEFWEKGTIPWFRMEDIRENGRILKDSIQHITPKALKNKKLFPKNSIIISTTATIGEHALLIVDSLANQRFTFLSKKANCDLALDMKFFFYQCFLLGEWCKNNTNVSGFASVDMTAFKKYKFPIPPLEVQQEIVKILDQFLALTTDLQTGIPAEIKARKKQYEYYREKLLTFKPLTPHKEVKK